MAIDVPMPKLGLTMEEGRIIDWLVADGEWVEADAPILVVETDKTETEIGSPGAGRLQRLGRPDETYRCGERIAYLLAEGEAPVGAVAPPAGAAAPVRLPAAPVGAPLPPPAAAIAITAAPALVTPTGRVVASPNARRVAAERGVDLRAVRGTGPGGRIVSEDVDTAPAPVARATVGASPGPAAVVVPAAGSLVLATLAARNLAELLGIDLATVPADPTDGRVTRDAVALHVRRLLATPSPTAPSPSATPAAPSLASMPLLQEPTRTIRLSGMRGTIAKRMTASLHEMAQLTLTMDADLAAVRADRATRAAAGRAPSYTDYVMAAAARALLRHPLMNAQVTETGIALLPEVHVGLAVAVDGGLLVPVVRDTAGRTLTDLAAETSRLAGAARAGALGPADLEGGTFSVSTLGMFGVDAFTPVINPPNAGILGVGRLRDDLVLVDGRVTTAPRLTLSLTWDHRVLDGAPAAEFGRTVVELLADPAALDAPAA